MFSCSEGANVQFGLDWFNAYKKHCDRTELPGAVVDNLEMGVGLEGKCRLILVFESRFNCISGWESDDHIQPPSLAMDDDR